MRKTRTFIALGLALAAAMLLIFMPSCTPKKQYFFNEGLVFGTYYNIRYEANRDLEKEITAELARMDSSLSIFNKSSIISRINRNDDVETDSLFEIMFKTAVEVTKMSHGGFDITCGPLVNIWGFGPDGLGYRPTQHEIDSILQFVGFQYVELDEETHHIAKMDTRIQMDASAIAKGYGCDIIAALLRSYGCENYLVDIGGEVVAKGLSDKGEKWKLGITKPIDDPTGEIQEIQEIIETDGICIASSGNYRRFYYDGGERRSHTVDPRTGYPVSHNLLSATVTASSGIRADALATACMVLGEEEALEMIENTEDCACHLILAEGDGTRVVVSSRWMSE
ncbi:MAG: FAD:protein FMN transferase [Paludibacteraceae bacterium]|nr:FAD:protein FMN transferase [Paludibacteraceae bacterium]